jgi:hypothetical protein
MSKFYSCAEWKAGVHKTVTKDGHDTWKQAKGVCDLLCQNGFGGDKQSFPVKVWVEDFNGNNLPRDPNTLHKISPERFVWEKYIGKVGYAVCQVCDDAYTEPLKLNSDVTFVGWCEASRIRIRQRDEGYVIMVEMDGEDFWFHTWALPIVCKETVA